MKIDAEQYKKILNEEGCNMKNVAKRMGISKQYASILLKRRGLAILKRAVFSKGRNKKPKG